MFLTDIIGIVADDLTGANDTALQFKMQGCETFILRDENCIPKNTEGIGVFAISTESRNTDEKTACERVKSVISAFKKSLCTDNIYKKIDSTLRGNIAWEIKTILDETDFDSALIFPAFPGEGRTTIGGYHLLRGFPVERTEFAVDPGSPVYESHIPTLLTNSLPEEYKNKVALIDFHTVKQGAGPILKRMNELVSEGKTFIVADAVTNTDIEQIVFAMTNSGKKILPCGSAGGAAALAKRLFDGYNHEEEKEIIVPKLPTLIVSGSATKVVAAQIERLENDDIDNVYFVEPGVDDIINEDNSEIKEKILNNLHDSNTVVIHTSKLFSDRKSVNDFLIDREFSKEKLLSLICERLGKITADVLAERQAVLVTAGGETAQKCCTFLDCEGLRVVDAVLPAIPLCVDPKGQYIITKSGNLGNTDTLADILIYLREHQ